jgi:hypothetical protein
MDFVTHNKVKIAANADAIWPHILDVESWRGGGQTFISVGGERGRVGERFHAFSAEAPDAPLYRIENVELIADQRRTLRMEKLDGQFLGFATWELTSSGGETLVAHDIYCRSAMLAPGQSPGEVLAGAQQMLDEGLLRLKALVEGGAPGQSRGSDPN